MKQLHELCGGSIGVAEKIMSVVSDSLTTSCIIHASSSSSSSSSGRNVIHHCWYYRLAELL